MSYAIPGDWADRAACRNAGNLFALDPGAGKGAYTAKLARLRIERSKAICAACPVLEQCRAWVMTDPDPAYCLVAGGLTPRERHALRKEGRAA